jgi:hypothetical protein
MVDFRFKSGSVVRVTPKLAEKWLGKNTHNRRVRARYVQDLARDMTAGKWVFNGDSIRFAKDGALMDGQHRLMAIVESGVTVKCHVVYGLDYAVMPSIDTGRVRTAADMFKLNGERHCNILSAATGIMFIVENHGMAALGDKSSGGTRYELEGILNAFPEARDSLGQVVGPYASLKDLAPQSSWVALHYYLSKKDPSDTELFFEQVATGDGVRSNEPIYHLRNRLINFKIKRIKLTRKEFFGLAVKTWNYFRKGKICKQLQFPAHEKFPAIT